MAPAKCLALFLLLQTARASEGACEAGEECEETGLAQLKRTPSFVQRKTQFKAKQQAETHAVAKAAGKANRTKKLEECQGSMEGINVCYFTNWARYRTGCINEGKDVFEMDLPGDICTHFMYGFATVTKDFDIKSNDPNADHPSGHAAQDGLCPEVCNDPNFKTDWSDPNAERCDWPCSPSRSMRGYEAMTVGMKAKNPDSKALISVGGWNFNDCYASPADTVGQGSATCELFSTIAASEASTRAFAQNVITFCRKWGFDGFDLDWEYPVVAGHNSNEKVDGKFQDVTEDYVNYVTMLEVMKDEFYKEADATGNCPLLLTAAVGVGLHTAETAYDIPGMSEHLDLINLMTYDLHGGWESRTGCNANLWATQEDVDFGGGVGAGQAVAGYPLSVSWAVDYWLEKGAPAEKLTMGLATYGRGWKLTDPNVHGYNAPASGASTPGECTKEAGYKAFYEVQELLASGQATRYYDEDRQCPYIVTNDGEWIGYDDQQSLAAKIEFAKSRHLAGTMVWALDLDDFAGKYEDDWSRYPLHKLMREQWYGGSGNVPTPPPFTPAPPPVATPTAAPVTAPTAPAETPTAAPVTAPTAAPATAPTAATPTAAPVTAPTAATPTAAPVAAPTAAAPVTAPTAAPVTAPTAPVPTPPAPAGSCVMQTDCSISAWCSDTKYESWCATQGAAGSCPAPQCVASGEASPVAAPTAAPVTAPTAAPVTGPTAAPTAAATPTAAPTSSGGSADCGTCATCLATNGVCYDQPKSWCDTFAFTWCA